MKMYVYVLMIMAIILPSTAYADVDGLLGVDSAIGVPHVLTPSEVNSLLGVGGGISASMGQDRIMGEAVSPSTAPLFGSDSTGRYWGFWDDPTTGLVLTCLINNVPFDCDQGTHTISGRKWFLEDSSGNRMMNFDPNASTPNTQYKLGTKKIISSYLFPLEPRGAVTVSSESIVTNQPKSAFMTITDANTDAVDFSFPVTEKMAGATASTFTLIGVSKNASPSGNIDFDCAMKKYTPGTNTFTAHDTTEEKTALLTPATQNRPVAVKTASHTINGGALVAGDIVFGSCEVDATATTSTQLIDFRLWGYVLVQLSVNSLSD